MESYKWETVELDTSSIELPAMRGFVCSPQLEDNSILIFGSTATENKAPLVFDAKRKIISKFDLEYCKDHKEILQIQQEAKPAHESRPMDLIEL